MDVPAGRTIVIVLVLLVTAACSWGGISSGQEPAVDGSQYRRLVHPEVAARLGLDDQQRVRLQSLLQERTTVVTSNAEEEEKKTKLAAIDQQIRETVTAEQWALWESTPKENRLRFQFRDQRWGDVLQWFAEQEGLTLVMNQEPSGTFTYSDPQSYSPSEAIDLLNSVLLTRGYTLVRREKMLTLLELTKTIPIELIPRVRLEETPGRGRFELISVLFSLGNRPVDAVLREVEPYLGNFGRAVPLPQSKQMLVVETAGKMETINVLINTVPEPKAPEKPQPPAPPPAPVFASYPIGNIDPTVALETVKKLVASEKITVDEKTRLLSAFVTPAEQTAIASVLEAMLQKITEQPPRTAQAYRLGKGEAQADRAEGIIAQLTELAPRAKLAFDAESNQLLVTADAEEQRVVADALKALGVTAIEDGLGSVRSFQVPPTQATTLATSLQSMMPEATIVANATLGTVVVWGRDSDLAMATEVIERWRGRDATAEIAVQAIPLERQATAAWLETLQEMVPEAQLWLDDSGKQLLILASAEDRARLENAIPVLLKSLPAPESRILKTYPLSARELGRWQQFQAGIATEIPKAQMIVGEKDPQGNAELWIWGNEDDQEKIAALILQVQTTTPEAQIDWPRVYPLNRRDGELIRQWILGQYPEVKIDLQPATDQFTLWAPLPVHDEVVKSLETLAAQLPAPAPLVWKSYQVPGMAVADLQTVVTPLLKVSAAGGGIAPSATIDGSGSRLLVRTTSENHSEIENFVQTLSQPLPPEQETILLAYSLESAQASDVKLLLEEAIKGVTIIADPKGNQIVASATLVQHGRIKAILGEVDSPARAKLQTEMRAYEVGKLNPTTVVTSLQTMWPKMTFTADVTTAKILAVGTQKDHEGLRQTIDRLLARPDDEPLRIETYSLAAGDLTTLPAILTQLAPEAMISTDTVNRLVVVWGTESQHQRIAKGIEQLSKAAEDRLEVTVYRVPPEQGVALRTTLLTMFPSISVAIDAAGTQLTVLAPKATQPQIAEIIAKSQQAAADTPRPLPQRYLVPVPLRAALTTLLASSYPTATVVSTSTSDTDGILISATEEQHRGIAQMLEQLKTQMPPDAAVVIKSYALGDIEPAAFATVLATRVPRAKILSGASTAQPLLAAADEDHQQVATVLEELRLAFQDVVVRDLQVYEVRPDLALQASSAVASVIPKATLLPAGDAPNRVSIIASPVEHQKYAQWLETLEQQIPEPVPPTSRVFPLRYADPSGAVLVLQKLLPKVTFAADILGKSISATAGPNELAEIEKFVAQYDQQREMKMELRSYPIEAADLSGLQKSLQATYPKATVTVDAVSGSLMVAAATVEHEQIKTMLDELQVALKNEANRQLKVYETRLDLAAQASAAVATVIPKATLLPAASTTNRLAILASDQEHAKYSQWLESLEQQIPEPVPPASRVFPLRYADPSGAVLVLQKLLPKVTFAADTLGKSISATAGPDELAEIEKFVAQYDQQRDAGKELRSYLVESAGVSGLQTALQATFPQATVAADTTSGSLVVAASSDEHEAIRGLVEQLNQAPTREAVLQVYRLAHADAGIVREALDDAFGFRSGVGVSADEQAGTVFVVGLPRQQNIAKQLIEQMDRADAGGIQRQLKRFPIGGIDGSEVAEAVESLFQSSRPPVDVRYDFINEQLVVVGSEKQLQLVEETLQQFKLPERQLEIFALRENDPARARDAITELFQDIPYNELPSISLDEDRQQLFIRATSTQLDEIRQLLERLGEKDLAEAGTATPKMQGGKRLRTLSVGRGGDDLLRRFQQAWPTIRKNPIRVIVLDETASEGEEPPPQEPSPAPPQPPEDADASLGDQVPRPHASGVSLVRTLGEEEQAGAEEESSGPGVGNRVAGEEPELPAVIVLPGIGRWTVMSADTEALDAIEGWLQGIVAPPVEPAVTSGNNAVYVLQHADATDLEEVLGGLFRRSERSSASGAGRGGTQVVADRRTNSLIVSGSRTDRAIIEELLSVLDSREMVDVIQRALPEVIPVQNAGVEEVERMLRTVYAAQLSSDGGRRPIAIPEGVSAEVASLLQQMNAAARGPVLTLAIDRPTNSLVIRGPRELSEEIRTFVQTIDQRTVRASGQRVKIIPLRGGNAEQIGEVLDNFRRRSRYRQGG